MQGTPGLPEGHAHFQPPGRGDPCPADRHGPSRQRARSHAIRRRDVGPGERLSLPAQETPGVGGPRHPHRRLRHRVRPRPRGAGVDRRAAPGHPARPLSSIAAALYVLFPRTRPRRLRSVAGLHARLCLLGRQGPPRRGCPGATARHPPEHPCAGFYARARARPRRHLPPHQRGPRARRGRDDLHWPGLEHDLQPLSLAEVGTG